MGREEHTSLHADEATPDIEDCRVQQASHKAVQDQDEVAPCFCEFCRKMLAYRGHSVVLLLLGVFYVAHDGQAFCVSAVVSISGRLGLKDTVNQSYMK